MLKRDPAIAASNLAGSLFEPAEVLFTNANLAAKAVEQVAEELDARRPTDATFVAIDHQFVVR